MFVLPSIERPRVNPVLLPLLLLLLAGCGGGSTRSLAPEPDGGARSASGVAAARDARAPGVFASRNLLPTATILDPAPDGLVRKGSEPASATYSALAPFSTYTFAVVAIDQRGGHDGDLARDRNVLDFALTLGPGIAAPR